MKTNNFFKKNKGISPIIATLLLILIAIAAGVIVYAYVVGFIGASTSNSGGTTDTLSIDQVSLSSKATSFPVTVYVRNQGPTAESFNTGFFVKGSTLNNQLGPAISLSVPTGTLSIASSTITITETTSNTVTVATSGATLTCSTTTTVTVSAFGTSNTASCTATASTLSVVLTLSVGTVSSSPQYSSTSGTITVTALSSVVVGTAITAGTISLPVNNVFDFTLASQGVQVTNPLSAGSTYNVQVTGTDGASTTASAKSS